MPKKQPTNPIEEEKLAQTEAEALSTEPDEASLATENLDEKAEESLIAEQAADATQTTPAELGAVRTDNESAQAVNKAGKKSQKATAGKKPKKATRSKKYLELKSHIAPGKVYALDEALELVKKTSLGKFDGAIELHIKLTKKKAKGSTESSRGVFHLPHGSGKTKKIIMLDEAKIENIAKTKKIDFDIALASPELMPKVARIAKILGPKGKMPDPKSGTVTTDPKKTIEEINSGKAEYRVDAGNNIHQIIGRVSWDNAKLKDNAQAVLSSMPKSRILVAYLAPSIGPSVALDLGFLK